MNKLENKLIVNKNNFLSDLIKSGAVGNAHAYAHAHHFILFTISHDFNTIMTVSFHFIGMYDVIRLHAQAMHLLRRCRVNAALTIQLFIFH